MDKKKLFTQVISKYLLGVIPVAAILLLPMPLGKWQQDFEADERGEVSLEVNRSVLSEDGLYDLLSDLDSLYSTFGDILTKAVV